MEDDDAAFLLSELCQSDTAPATPAPQPVVEEYSIATLKASAAPRAPGVLSLATPTVSASVDVAALTAMERTTGVQLSRRSTSEVTELIRVAAGRTIVPLRSLATWKSDQPWATAAVVVRKFDPKTNAHGGRYGVVRLWGVDSVCASSAKYSCSLLLAGIAFDMAWSRLVIGSIVVVAEATIQVETGDGGQSGVLLKANAAGVATVLGPCATVATCGHTTKAGSTCDVLINKSKGSACSFHLPAAARAARMEPPTAMVKRTLFPAASAPVQGSVLTTKSRETFICTRAGVRGAVDGAGRVAGASVAPLVSANPQSYAAVSAPLASVPKIPIHAAAPVLPRAASSAGERMLVGAVRNAAAELDRQQHEQAQLLAFRTKVTEGTAVAPGKRAAQEPLVGRAPPQPLPPKSISKPRVDLPPAMPAFKPLRRAVEDTAVLLKKVPESPSLYATSASAASSQPKGLAAAVGLSRAELHNVGSAAAASQHEGLRAVDVLSARQKRLEAIEREAAADEALSKVSEMEVAAYHCHTCKRWYSSRPALCAEKRHTVIPGNTTKRFYNCRKCTYHLSVLGNETPWTMECPRCGNVVWDRGTAARVRRVRKVDQNGDPVSDDEDIRAVPDQEDELQITD